MATAPDIKAQIAVIPNTKCQLCEEYNINWKCFNCNEYLCHQCKKSHLKSKASRDHRVTTIKGADKQEQHGHEEKHDPNCSFHPQKNLSLYCKECDLPICTDCIVGGSHKHHTILKIKDIIDEKQRELSSVIDESNQKLSKFKQNMKIIQKIRTDYSRDVGQCIETVKAKNVLLKSTLDQITNEIIKTLQKIETQNQEQIKETEKLTENDISELTEIIIKCRENQAKRETEMIQFVRDVKQRLNQFKVRNPPDPLHRPVFLTRNVDVEKVKDLFGDLDTDKGSDYDRSVTASSLNTNPTIDVKVLSTFNMPEINIVAAVSDTQAWLGGSGTLDKRVTLVTSNGKTMQTVKTDFYVYDLAVTKSGELFVTMFCGNKLKKLTSGGRFVDLYVDPAGYETRGITVTDSNDIIVCLHIYEGGKLVQFSPAGQQIYSKITTIQYDRDGKTPLFNNPWRVKSNRNGDLIVVNRSGKEVLVVDENGHRRFTYTGQVGHLKESFNPCYTVTDQYGHIMISDGNNSVIHLLDRDGKFLQFLVSDKHGITYPWGMSIDKSGRLWVCNYGQINKVMVVKYV